MHSFSFVTEIPGRVQTFKELQKEFFWFPQFPFGHFVFIFRSEIFASTLFLFFLRCSLVIHRGPSSSFSSWPVGRPINQVFLLCPRRGFCMRRQDGGIHRTHKYARAPDTKKSQQGDCKDRRHLHCKVQKTRQCKEISSRQKNTLH